MTARRAAPAERGEKNEEGLVRDGARGGCPRPAPARETAGGTTFGYARVSTRDQNLARQIDALREFGVEERLIYCDKASGKDFCRPRYQRLVRRMRPGDTLVIKSVDRLGRRYADILEEWRRLTKERRVSIVVLDMPLLDTRTDRDGLTGELMADIVLQLLSYVAQVERDNIRQRQAEGIAAAQARGVRFGRPRLERPDAFERASRAYAAHEMTGAEAALACGVSRSTFLRWVREG